MGRWTWWEVALLGLLIAVIAGSLSLILMWLIRPEGPENRQASQLSSGGAEARKPPFPAHTTSPSATGSEAGKAAQTAEARPVPPVHQGPLRDLEPAPFPQPVPVPVPQPEPRQDAPVEDFGHVGPDEKRDSEDPVTCPAGEVTVVLDSVQVTNAGSSNTRTVELSGRVQNNATAAVDISLTSAIDVMAIDGRGEHVVDVYPEVEYVTAPGEIRPMDVALQPGEVRKFSHDDETFGYDWDTITHWVIDPISTENYLFYAESHDPFCDFQVPVRIIGEPIPASGR